MRRSKPFLESRQERQCRWCNDQLETFQGLCNSCDNELKRKWKEYEVAMNVLVTREEALFDMCFAAAYGKNLFHTFVFNQERLALRNIEASQMENMAGYCNDLRAGRIASINRSLTSRAVSLNSNTTSVPSFMRSGHPPGTAATQQADPPDLNVDDPLMELRFEILVHWPPETDDRASKFVNESIHTKSFLKLLLKLAPHYSWEDTTRMVNSMIIERIRHGDSKQRCHIREDFWNVFEICRDLEYVPTDPDAITLEEIMGVNSRICKWGLLKDGYDFSPEAESKGVCNRKHPCCAAEQASTAFVFKYQYRNRCQHLRTVTALNTRSLPSDEGYGGSTYEPPERTDSQHEQSSGSQYSQSPGQHRAWY